jgi:catechol 2,3-dioxygenase-like lactoylglutathione lyase family enzyme
MIAGMHRHETAPRPPPFTAQRILRISRVVANLERAESFYRRALGFHTVAKGVVGAAALTAFDLPDAIAEEVVMRLGAEEIALVGFAARGRPYPPDSRSNDLWFQHLAIVVRDMDAAHAHLSAVQGWHPISEGGPQLLPPSNGGVRAFKFRDPDGHPLELLWLPPGSGRPIWRDQPSDTPFLGIDHSAISVASTHRSLRFYEALGLGRVDRSLNLGSAQERLDGLPGSRVRVTGLRPASGAGPGLELLAYRPPGRTTGATGLSDQLTDWVTVAVSPAHGVLPRAVLDPDRHRLLLVSQGAGAAGLPACGPMT